MCFYLLNWMWIKVRIALEEVARVYYLPQGRSVQGIQQCLFEESAVHNYLDPLRIYIYIPRYFTRSRCPGVIIPRCLTTSPQGHVPRNHQAHGSHSELEINHRIPHSSSDLLACRTSNSRTPQMALPVRSPRPRGLAHSPAEHAPDAAARPLRQVPQPAGPEHVPGSGPQLTSPHPRHCLAGLCALDSRVECLPPIGCQPYAYSVRSQLSENQICSFIPTRGGVGHIVAVTGHEAFVLQT